MVDEDKKSRLDRELIELLNELRVVLPGVQVLFAFLLTVPFTQRFEEVTTAQRGAFFVALAATALSSVLLIAPSANHRLLWRQHDKDALLRQANRLAIGGLVLLSIAITAATFLIADVVYDERAAAAGAATLACAIAVFWFVLPLARRVQREH